MGRLGVTALPVRVGVLLAVRASLLQAPGSRGRAHRLLALGAVLVAGGLWILVGPGWALLASGVMVIVYAFVLVDVDEPAARVSGPDLVRVSAGG